MTLLQTADDVSRIAFGYMGSKALFSALDLGVFTALSMEPRTTSDLADAVGAREDALQTLLTALSGIGLVELQDDLWANAPASEAFLVKGAKYDFGDYLRLQVGRQMFPMIGQIDGVLTGHMKADAISSYAQWFSDPDQAKLYSQSQHAGSLGPARQLAKSLNIEGPATLLDVGGGTGAFAITLCQHFPQLTAFIVDFPNVASIGKNYVEEAGLSERITYIEGDGRDDIWKRDVDLILMSYLFSGVPAAAHGTLVKRAYDHLAPQGRLLIHDFIVDSDRSGPPLAALWQLQHLAFTPEGRSICIDVIEAELAAAGFAAPDTQPMIPEMTMLTVAQKPA